MSEENFSAKHGIIGFCPPPWGWSRSAEIKIKYLDLCKMGDCFCLSYGGHIDHLASGYDVIVAKAWGGILSHPHGTAVCRYMGRLSVFLGETS